jgi:hypothetical protein
MFRPRRPFPPLPSSPRHLCALRVSALSPSYPFPSAFNLKHSTFNRSSLSPFPATLAALPQRIENKATLSLVFATLARLVNRNLFVCHSYKKLRGVGYPAQSKSLSNPHISANSFIIRTSEIRACNPCRIRTSKTQDLKSFRIRTYKKRGRGGLVCSARLRELCVSALKIAPCLTPSQRKGLSYCRL